MYLIDMKILPLLAQLLPPEFVVNLNGQLAFAYRYQTPNAIASRRNVHLHFSARFIYTITPYAYP